MSINWLPLNMNKFPVNRFFLLASENPSLQRVITESMETRIIITPQLSGKEVNKKDIHGCVCCLSYGCMSGTVAMVRYGMTATNKRRKEHHIKHVCKLQKH